MIWKGESVELLPRPPYILSFQMDLIRKHQLRYKRVGKEPDARLCILPLQEGEDSESGGDGDEDVGYDDYNSSNGSVDRLPLLPD